MTTLNENMTIHQVRMVRKRNGPQSWGPIPDEIKNAFLYRNYRIETVKAGTKLWKMTQYDFNTNRVTPWWSPVMPYKDDLKGVRGNLREAAYNGVSAITYVRIAAAVRFDWNRLTMLQQITLKQDAKGLWGQFAPQPNLSPDKRTQYNELIKESPHIPNMVGGLGAWQFWIPNLTGESAKHDFSERNEDAWVRRLGVILPKPHPFV